MGLLLGLPQFEAGPADDHLVAELDELDDQFLEVEGPRPAPDQGYVVDAVGCLEVGVFVELVDDDARDAVLPQVYDDAGAFLLVLLVVDM